MKTYEQNKKNLLHYLKILDLLEKVEILRQEVEEHTLKVEALKKQISGDIELE